MANDILLVLEETYKDITVTSGINGYPKNLKGGLIGFTSFDEVENVLKEIKQEEPDLDVEIVLFHRKDGWGLWESKGRVYKPLSCDDKLRDLGDNYNVYDIKNSLDIIYDRINDCNNIQDIENLFKNYYELIVEYNKRENENDVIVEYCGKYYETIPFEMMGYSEDTHNYQIGILINE